VDRHWRLVSGAIGFGGYLVVGWLFASRLVGGGSGAIDQSAYAASPPFTSMYAPAARAVDRGITEMKRLFGSIVDGPTYSCLVAAHLVSADAILITSSDFVGMSGVLDCQ